MNPACSRKRLLLVFIFLLSISLLASACLPPKRTPASKNKEAAQQNANESQEDSSGLAGLAERLTGSSYKKNSPRKNNQLQGGNTQQPSTYPQSNNAFANNRPAVPAATPRSEAQMQNEEVLDWRRQQWQQQKGTGVQWDNTPHYSSRSNSSNYGYNNYSQPYSSNNRYSSRYNGRY